MIFNKEIDIAGKIISNNSNTFIIAEAGVNHNGDLSTAFKLVDVAVTAGVDAVKFQAFKAKNLILKNVTKAPYQQLLTDKSESQYEMLKSLELTKEHNILLKDYCDDKGIIFLTTAFDEESLDELDDLNVSAYKIASTDTTNIHFFKKNCKKKQTNSIIDWNDIFG